MNRNTVLRVARPTDNLETIAQMYMNGLGFECLYEFKDHDGFDGVILGLRSHSYHLEFTRCAGERAGKAPTKDNLLVFYIPDKPEWILACKRMQHAGFNRVASSNPYWDVSGTTFEDIDRYRVVIQNEQWSD
jgi:hypothetical protein